jgi:hypothetical protein
MTIQRHIHNLAFAATAALVVLASSSPAVPQPAENNKLPTTKKLGAFPSSYWNTFGGDPHELEGTRKQTNRFRNAPKSTATSLDQFKLGDSYLGIETKRQMRPPVSSQRSGCTTDEECEDYSPIPKSKAGGSAGAVL